MLVAASTPKPRQAVVVSTRTEADDDDRVPTPRAGGTPANTVTATAVDLMDRASAALPERIFSPPSESVPPWCSASAAAVSSEIVVRPSSDRFPFRCARARAVSIDSVFTAGSLPLKFRDDASAAALLARGWPG